MECNPHFAIPGHILCVQTCEAQSTDTIPDVPIGSTASLENEPKCINTLYGCNSYPPNAHSRGNTNDEPHTSLPITGIPGTNIYCGVHVERRNHNLHFINELKPTRRNLSFMIVRDRFSKDKSIQVSVGEAMSGVLYTSCAFSTCT